MTGPATTDTGAAPDSCQAANRSPWAWFLARRIPRLLISLWVLMTFAFAIVHLVPGDPVRKALGINATAELVRDTRKELGFDDPLPLQYLHYLQQLFSGDLGVSLTSRLPVSSTIGQLLPNTLLLAFVAFLVVMLVSVPLGLGMAILTQNGRKRALELGYTTVAIIIGAIPDFLLAVGLVYVFGVSTGWLPIAGKEGVSSFILPVLALSMGAIAGVSRIVRVETLAVLGQDFIRTARAKRLRWRRIYLRHALPNALTATLTISGLLLSGLVAGTVLVESIFAWPGLGPQLVSSILARDYPMVQAIVLIYGGLVLVINFLVDVLLAVADPRSRIKDT